jgi:hypothetical protein
MNEQPRCESFATFAKPYFHGSGMKLLNLRKTKWSRRTVDLMVLRQALVDLLLCRKLLDPKEVVGASGFEPPTSWSRTTRIKI